MSWYSSKTFHECKQVCTYRLLSSSISARNQALVTQAECQQDYSSPCSPVLTSECGSMRSLRAWILQAPWKCDCEVQYTQKIGMAMTIPAIPLLPALDIQGMGYTFIR